MPINIVVDDEKKSKITAFVDEDWRPGDLFWYGDKVYMVTDEVKNSYRQMLCLNDGV